MVSKSSIVEKPRSIDVLCGRGKTCFEHQGNDDFRKVVAQHIDAYNIAPTKKAKMQVVVKVVDIIISRGGRFLIRKSNQGGPRHWVDGGRKQGKKKTGHALRDALRGRVKCVAKLRVENDLSKMIFPSQIMSLNYTASSSTNCDSSLDTQDTDEFFSACLSSLESDSEELLPSLCNELTQMEETLSTELEPEREWRQSNLEFDTAHDLLAFFHREKNKCIIHAF